MGNGGLSFLDVGDGNALWRELVDDLSSLSAGATDHELLEKLNPETATYLAFKRQNFSELGGVEEFGRRVCAALGWDPAVNQQVRDPFGSGSLSAFAVGQSLVALARFRAAERVLADLRELVTANQVGYLQIVPLWGILPHSTIDLGVDSVRLVPLDELSPSSARDQVAGIRAARAPDYGSPLAIRPRATAALVRSDKLSPLFLPPDVTDLSGFPHDEEPAREMLNEVADVLVIAVKSPVVAFGYWVETDPDTPCIQWGGGGFRANQGFLGREPQPHDVDAALVREIVTSYMSFAKEDRRRLRVTLARLNTSLIQRDEDPTEAMIDLGIAMESFLCPDKEPKEVSFRFALRGALYLGGSQRERKNRRATLKQIYGARSDAVHEGTMGKRSQTDQVALLDEGRDLLIAMVRKAIAGEGRPQWEDVELADTPAATR